MFNITFETITPESAENGEAEETGFLDENLTFREAMDAMRWHMGTHVEADSYPISRSNPPRWFTFYGETDYRTGETQNVSLHLPDNLTPSTKLRIARFVGCKVKA